jgi:hypothetical protein
MLHRLEPQTNCIYPRCIQLVPSGPIINYHSTIVTNDCHFCWDKGPRPQIWTVHVMLTQDLYSVQTTPIKLCRCRTDRSHSSFSSISEVPKNGSVRWSISQTVDESWILEANSSWRGLKV